MFAWHSGDVTSCYFGIQAGFANPVASASPFHNTFVGYQVDKAFNGANGGDNTAMGYLALTANVGNNGLTFYGNQNVAIGAYALTTLNPGLIAFNNLGNNNTAVGWSALKMFNPASAWNPAINTAVGSQSLMNTDTGRPKTQPWATKLC